jgi:tRNA(Ile)-lysidine synthase
MQVFRTLPKKLVVALSGGSDSMACLHYFLEKGYDVSVAHYIHYNSLSAEPEYEFVKETCSNLDVKLFVEKQDVKLVMQSNEEFWRNGRYRFFRTFTIPVITGHTLNDMVEWYLYSAMNGKGYLMDYSHGNVVRPFFLERKESLLKSLTDKQLTWFEDPSNTDIEFCKRNKVRHNLLPEALSVNPGLFTMIKRMAIEKYRGL